MKNDLTEEQATDLARYFLGPGWTAHCYRPSAYTIGGCRLINHQGEGHFMGAGWRDVFRVAGVRLPSRPQYTRHGSAVMLGQEHIALCVSGSKADLICDALNAYQSATNPLQ